MGYVSRILGTDAGEVAQEFPPWDTWGTHIPLLEAAVEKCMVARDAEAKLRDNTI